MSGITATVDKSQLEQKLANIVSGIQNQPKAMNEAALILMQFVFNTFRDETDPWGTHWPDLKPATLKARLRKDELGSQQMLIATHAMYDSIKKTSDGTSLTVEMGAGLEYPSYQQFGVPENNLPARATFPLMAPDEPSFPTAWIDAVLVPIQQGIQELTQ